MRGRPRADCHSVGVHQQSGKKVLWFSMVFGGFSVSGNQKPRKLEKPTIGKFPWDSESNKAYLRVAYKEFVYMVIYKVINKERLEAIKGVMMRKVLWHTL